MPEVKFTEQSYNKETGEAVWIIDGPRLSFPTLWELGTYKNKAGKVTPNIRHYASFVIPLAEKAVCKKIQTSFIKIANDQDKDLKKVKDIGEHPKIVVDKEKGMFIVKSSNSVKSPAVYFDFKGKVVKDPLGANADAILYPGCHVKIKLTLNYSKGDVWVNLAAIQFSDDGERFGGGLSGDELSEGFGEVEGDFDKPTSKSDTDDFDDDFDDDDDDLEIEDDDDDDLELDD